MNITAKRTLFVSVIICLVVLMSVSLAFVSSAADISDEISLNKHAYRMIPGDTLLLSTSVPAGASYSYAYASDAESVATVSNGLVTAVGEGEATITVTVTSGDDTGTDQIKIFVNTDWTQPVDIATKEYGTQPATKPIITFLGDSITAGSQVNSSQIYHALLEERLYITRDRQGLSGSNIAGPGSNSQASFLDRVPDINKDTDLIFVFGGINDYGQGHTRTLNDYKKGLRVLIEELIINFPDEPIIFSTPLQNVGYFGKTSGGAVVDVTQNNKGETLESYVLAVEEACLEYGIPTIRAWKAEELECFYDENGDGVIDVVPNKEATTYYADGLHPNATGHELLADFYEQQIWNAGVVRYDGYTAKVYGDIDGDGKFTPAELVKAARAESGWAGYTLTTDQQDMCDADDNGDFDANDVIYLGRHIARWKGYERLPVSQG